MRVDRFEDNPMGERAHATLPFLTLLITCSAGMLHTQWWAVCAGACVLILISLIERQFGANKFLMFQRGVSDPVLALSSVLNGSVAAAAAFGFGHVTGLVWGL